MRQSFIAERRVAKADAAERRRSGERFQARPFDERVTEIERAQIGERCELVEGAIVEQRVAHVEAPQRVDRCEMLDTKVADLRVAQTELFELRQLLQEGDLSIRYRRRVERHGDAVAVLLPHLAADRSQPVRNRLLAFAGDRRRIDWRWLHFPSESIICRFTILKPIDVADHEIP